MPHARVDGVLYFLYRQISPIRRELVGRANSEDRACALAIEHSRHEKHTIFVSAHTPATLESRPVGRFRDGASLNCETRS